jgi:hypothetical protein
LIAKIEEKNTPGNFFSLFFKSKITEYLSLDLHKGRPSYRRSPQKRTSSTSKNEIINFFPFCGSFLPSVHPDPDCESGSGYGSMDTIEYGSDPDLQPWSSEC